ncbi:MULTISPECIES: M61 family metallopeptidase [unclassified Leptolyngbya]|uniref:M61 family metallopeptidase n=1 Tax=unclassified Leptolyngbya TaxID=2650499 RepID=UPI0016852334|nr:MULTISPECIES: M61 family metallopeptidase [unclassified Leptolyngbya]MBD1910991.1 M61 family metallopeptidase [Leptolyngbya sp. FACHB-8]MBD2158342.1 M61 family metallopeptidase [Leptolyngbya sp. FACHB-16]
MTEAIETAPLTARHSSVGLHYRVAMSQPESHLFEITLEVRGWRSPVLDLKMPVWTPGSYLVREYARHVQDFAATAQQKPLPWSKVSKNHWRIDTNGTDEITISYRLFANELTVRTNHLDGTHGYFNGAATFFYIPNHEKTPLRLTLVPPHATWKIATTLPPVPGQPNTFEAPDFDTLVDCPVEIGEHTTYSFDVLGKPHQFVVWGQNNLDSEALLRDTRKVVETEAELFGGLPYSQYLFLLHLSNQGYGGLEHKDSCTLNYSRFVFRSAEKYSRFMQLVAHEFFHLWNVKRIRPKALEVFNYDGECYTPSLWFSEGTTSYYDLLIPLRAGIYDARHFLREMSREITRFLTTPGRRVQPLGESSFDAWIKLYRRDANSDNSQISYYLKGEMVSLLLDLLIRARHGNARSLDDVLRQMWHQFGQDEIGFLPEQLEAIIAGVAGADLNDFFQRYLHTTEELPFDTYLEPFGLRLKPDDVSHAAPFTGMQVRSEHGRDVIKFVEYGSPAQRAGLDAGDELLALDGLRVTAEQLSDRLQDYQPGDTVEVTFFHQDVLRVGVLHLAPPRPMNYHIVPVEQPTPIQQANLKGWLSIATSDLA